MPDITRSDAAALIQDAYSDVFFNEAFRQSTALSAFPTRSLGTKTTNIPVLSTKPHAKWVNESATDDDGKKPTGKVTWGNKTLIAEELAIIVPVHENVLADATEDILAEIAKAGGEGIANALDAAVFFGHQKPGTWTSRDLLASATHAGNLHELGSAEDGEDLSGSILQAAEDVAEFYDPDTILAPSGLRFRLANQRDANGSPIYVPVMEGTPGNDGSVHGLRAAFVSGTVSDGANGDAQIWDRDEAVALVVDRTRVIIGVRQDITVKFLDQATVGGINLAERDMVALRFVARFAYALGDNKAQGVTAATNSPVAAVLPAGS